MKVFVSHKQEDANHAALVAARLRSQGSDAYLDVLDPHGMDGPHLADYLRDKLSQCTDLIAVVSPITQSSWWVPWEIGVANEKDYPLATYAAGQCKLPSFLMKWPYLQTLSDVDTYVRERNRTDQVLQYARASASYRSQYASSFFTNLRSALGQ